MHVDRCAKQQISLKLSCRECKNGIWETKAKPRAFADSYIFIIDLNIKKISKQNFLFLYFVQINTKSTHTKK